MKDKAILLASVIGLINISLALYSVYKMREIGIPQNFASAAKAMILGTDLSTAPRATSVGSPKNRKDDPKILIAFTQYIFAFIGSLLAIAASMDPAGLLGITGFGYWYSFMISLISLGFAFISYWVFSWIQFLLEYNKFSRAVVVRTRTYGFNVTMALTLFVDVLHSAFVINAETFQRKCELFGAVFLCYWWLCMMIFASVVTILTWRTLRMLKVSSVHHRSYSSDVKRISNRTYIINVLALVNAFFMAFGLAIRSWRSMCGDISRYNWFWLICTITSPLVPSVLVIFNRILLSNDKEDEEQKNGQRTSRTSEPKEEAHKPGSPTSALKTPGQTPEQTPGDSSSVATAP